MSNPSQLFLLADHIKLSLLERQRAISLKLDPTPTQSSHISRSLESFREGLEALERSPRPNASDADHLQRLRSQYNDLSRQFYGDTISSTAQATITSPNDPSLSSDFDRAQQSGKRPPSHSSNLKREPSKSSKSVRFRDNNKNDSDEEADRTRTALFPAQYTDNPSPPEPDPAVGTMSNEQIHAYHSQVIAEQDEQLDRLGDSIGRQRHISMQIGDELEGQVELLDDVDRGVDRHQGRLDGATRRLKGVGGRARENWGMTTIIVLIVVLVLLIVILK
jgi:syntaxin 8